MEDSRTLAFLTMASWVCNAATSQAEPSSTALSLLRHSKHLLQPTQVFLKSPCLRGHRLFNTLSRRKAPLRFKTSM